MLPYQCLTRKQNEVISYKFNEIRNDTRKILGVFFDILQPGGPVSRHYRYKDSIVPAVVCHIIHLLLIS